MPDINNQPLLAGKATGGIGWHWAVLLISYLYLFASLLLNLVIPITRFYAVMAY